MERRSKPDKNRVIKGAALFLIVFTLTVIISIFVRSLAFNYGPSINGGSVVYTANDLVCSWTVSADVSQTNVSWYNGSTLFSNETAGQNSSTLGNQYTARDESWTCQVTLGNGTDILVQNTSISINNTPPSTPILKKDGSQIYNYYSLYEDIAYTIYINATDADNDDLIFDMSDTASFDACSEPNPYTGQMTCDISHQIIKQSASLGSEQPRNHTIRILAGEDRTPGITIHDDFIFTLIPVNDKPYFVGTVPAQFINAGNNWSVMVTAQDEELNYPINFTVSSDLNDLFPGLIIITNLSQTTANISFSTPTTNSHVGTWNVAVNITEFNVTNMSQLTFTLNINTSNYAPSFTNNFTLLSAQNWTQGGSLDFWLNATDSNINDTLTFNITPPTNTALRCNVSFPWNITTLNNSYEGAYANVTFANLTNEHVACRYVNLIVYDPYGGISTQPNFLLNVSNINDAPLIYEMGLDGNISNISVKKFQRLTYRVYAYDPDIITYNGNATANLTFSSNDSLRFPINATTGAVTIYPIEDSFIGNWTVNITVSDGELSDSINMNIEIRDNSVPVLNISENNLTFSQNNIGSLNFSVVEPDNEDMTITYESLTSFADSLYDDAFDFIDQDNVGGTNNEYWAFNLSLGPNVGDEAEQREILRRRNDLVGNHVVNVTIMDEYATYSENMSAGVLNVTITNDNDAPFFDMNRDNVSDSVSFTNIVFNYSYGKIINVTDFDFYLGAVANESLTFNYSQESAGLDNISLVPLAGSNYSAILTFTGIIMGNQSINITVTDSQGLSSSQVVYFEVEPRTPAPEFNRIRPYFNTTLNYTVSDFVDVSLYPTNITNINISENTSYIFDAYVTNASVEGNYISFSWYVDGVLESSIENVTCGVNSAFTHYFDFFSSNRTNNITLIVTDFKLSTSFWTWLVNVTNVNRPPVYCSGGLENLSVEGISTIYNYLSFGSGQRFYDPDDDLLNTGENQFLTCSNYSTANLPSLTYEIIEMAPCEIAEFSIAESNLRIEPSIDGVCLLQFIAEDDYGLNVTSSDTVQIVMIASESSGTNTQTVTRTETRTETVTVPINRDVNVPAAIKIIAPGTVNMYTNKTIELQIKIKNTWTTDVKGISLSATSSNYSNTSLEGVTMNFTNSYFSTLPVGAETETTLRLSDYRKEGPFEIIVTASVTEPEFNDSVSILISGVEQLSQGDEVKVKITFAKDLLSENSVCRELNELLDRANSAAQTENFQEAIRLVDGVINGCKYLMKEEEVRRESPSMIKTGFDAAREYTIEIIAGAGLLLILVLIFYAIAALRKKISEK